MNKTISKNLNEETNKFLALIMDDDSFTAPTDHFLLSGSKMILDPRIHDSEETIEINGFEYIDENFTKFIIPAEDLNTIVASMKVFNVSNAGMIFHAIVDQGEDVSTSIKVQEDTAISHRKKELEKLYKDLISLGEETNFKQAMENDYTKKLYKIIVYYENIALDVLTNIFDENGINELLVSDTLIWLGLFRHENTQYKRLRILIHFLNSASTKIRYGAVIGLENLDDLKALPFIIRAMNQEKFEPLQMEMKNVIESMKEDITDDYIEANRS